MTGLLDRIGMTRLLEDARGRISTLESDLSVAEQRNRQQGARIAALEADLDDARGRAGSFEDAFAALRATVERLYYAAHWSPDRSVDAATLWTDVRDAAGLTPGETGKRLGEPRHTTSERYTIVSDDDGHDFVIPADKVDDWHEYMKSDYFDDTNERDYARYINGALTRLTFTDPVIGG